MGICIEEMSLWSSSFCTHASSESKLTSWVHLFFYILVKFIPVHVVQRRLWRPMAAAWSYILWLRIDFNARFISYSTRFFFSCLRCTSRALFVFMFITDFMSKTPQKKGIEKAILLLTRTISSCVNWHCYALTLQLLQCSSLCTPSSYARSGWRTFFVVPISFGFAWFKGDLDVQRLQHEVVGKELDGHLYKTYAFTISLVWWWQQPK